MGHKTCRSFLSAISVGNSFPFDKCLASYAGDALRTAVGLRVKCTFFSMPLYPNLKWLDSPFSIAGVVSCVQTDRIILMGASQRCERGWKKFHLSIEFWICNSFSFLAFVF